MLPLGLETAVLDKIINSNSILTRLSFDILGAFGNVKLAWLKDNSDNKFAIKAMKKKEIIDSKHVDHIENEKKILEQLEHPFIVCIWSKTYFFSRCYADLTAMTYLYLLLSA